MQPKPFWRRAWSASTGVILPRYSRVEPAHRLRLCHVFTASTATALASFSPRSGISACHEHRSVLACTISLALTDCATTTPQAQSVT